MKEKILIIYSCGASSGFGHYKRSLFLEKKLKKKNQVFKLCLEDSKTLHLKIYKLIIRSIRLNKIKKVFYDINIKSKIFKKELLKTLIFCKKNNILTIGIDSAREFFLNLDHVWIPSPYKEKRIVGKNIIYGWDKILIDRPKKNYKYKYSKNIFILIGAAKNNFLLKKLSLLVKKYFSCDFKVNWVIGKFSSTKKINFLNEKNYKVLYNIKSVQKTLLSGGYVFCLYGLSFFESLSLGMPTSCYCSKKNKKKDYSEINFLKKEKIAFIDSNLEKSVSNLRKLIKNKALSKKFSNRSKKKISIFNYKKLESI
jgi:spore coat polysaccharide biosynthesis predicted glycosyltransferase SpsG